MDSISEQTRPGFIYLFTFPNGKQYVGQTYQEYLKRWKQHEYTSTYTNGKYYDLPLYRAVRLYGWENVIREIICECEISQLNDIETSYIKLLKTLHPNGYNLTSGGDSPDLVCDETKNKMRMAQNKRYENPESLIKLSIAQKKRYENKPMSDTTKNNISVSKNKYYSEHDMSQEIKDKIGQKARERYAINPVPLDVRNRMSKNHRKHGLNLPRGVCIRHGSRGISYRLRNHPKCRSKSFISLQECLIYLFILDHGNIINEIKNKITILKQAIDRRAILIDNLEKCICLVTENIENMFIS